MASYKKHTIMNLDELLVHSERIGYTGLHVPLNTTSLGIVSLSSSDPIKLSDPDNARFVVGVETEFNLWDEFNELHVTQQQPVSDSESPVLLGSPKTYRVYSTSVVNILENNPNACIIHSRNEFGYMDLLHYYE